MCAYVCGSICTCEWERERERVCSRWSVCIDLVSHSSDKLLYSLLFCFCTGRPVCVQYILRYDLVTIRGKRSNRHHAWRQILRHQGTRRVHVQGRDQHRSRKSDSCFIFSFIAFPLLFFTLSYAGVWQELYLYMYTPAHNVTNPTAPRIIRCCISRFFLARARGERLSRVWSLEKKSYGARFLFRDSEYYYIARGQFDETLRG